MNKFALIAHSIRDFCYGVIKIPWKKKSDYGFVFLIHPRSLRDVYRKYPILKKFPDKAVLFLLKHYWPITVSKITGLKSQITGKDVPGWLISIPLTAHQIMEDRALTVRHIIRSARLAENLGAKIMGLGALTASMTRGGLDVIDKSNIYITTGHAYTAQIVTANLFKFIEMFSLKKDNIKVAVVGAAGSVGSSSAKILAKNGIKNILLIDIERKNELLEDLIKEIKQIDSAIYPKVSHKINLIKDCDFIITATNTPEAIIKYDDLKPGAIVIDDAQPSDVSAEVLTKQDVLVIEAGIIHTPGIRSHFDLGLKDKYDNFCCLGEVMILASVEFKGNFCIGRGADLSQIEDINKMASGLNFRLAEFQNFNESISVEKLDIIKKIIYNHNI